MLSVSKLDIFEITLKETALEGLDGITVPTLWQRLLQREIKIPTTLSEALKLDLWDFLIQHPHIQFFVLPEDREEPVIFNRFLGLDIHSGHSFAIAPDELDILNDVYPVKPVQDKGIKGSCCHYHERKDVTQAIKTENLSLLHALDRYQKKRLVIVTSQKMREETLLAPGICPQVVEDLTDREYCILERLGRARWQGEIQTVLNTVVFKELKASHIHYVMKSLCSKGLVTKQSYSYRRPDKGNKLHQQVLLHLPHFKVDSRSTLEKKVDCFFNFLQHYDNQTITVGCMKQMMGLSDSAFKQLKKKLVSNGVIELLGKSGKKSNPAERVVRLLKKPESKSEEESEEDMAVAMATSGNDCLGLVAELPIAYQGYRYLISTGENGCSQLEMLKLLKGYGTLEGRHVCRKIDKAGVVRNIMIDCGKQRMQKYIAKHFASNSKHTKQFLSEQKKMQEMMETSVLSNASALDSDTTSHPTDDASHPTDDAVPQSECKSDVTASSSAKSTGNTWKDDESNISSSTSRLDDQCVTLGELSASNLLSSLNDTSDSVHSRNKWESQLTTRKMRRTNLILSYINEQKVIEGFFALQKYLLAEESREGITSKICKKTVSRIVQRMHDDSLLKYLTLPVMCNGTPQQIDFVMSLDCSTARLKTAIEQTRFRVLSQDGKKHENGLAEEHLARVQSKAMPLRLLNVGENLDELVKSEDVKPTGYIQTGYQPKFLRAKAVHQYLWYLAYGHPMRVKPDSSTDLIDYDTVKEYNPEKSWKRFLPPVPQHPDYGPGWVQVGEVGVLLPLTVICSFQRYSYEIEGIEEYLCDPIQRHTLVRHLPLKIKALLLHKRKYLFSLMQMIEMLCFMGLATLSQQKHKNSMCLRKEEEMVYIHKNVCILDTTTSDKSYMHISSDIEYKRQSLQLNNAEDVEMYWRRLQEVCVMTPLGVNNAHESDLELPKHTVQMKKFIQKHVKRDVMTPLDNHAIPGDGKGAGGFDSTLFSHLYRNWFRTAKTKKVSSAEKAKENSGDQHSASNEVRRLPKLVPTVIKDLAPSAAKRKKKSGGDSGKDSSSDLKRKRKSTCDDATSRKRKKKNTSGKDATANEMETRAESGAGDRETAEKLTKDQGNRTSAEGDTNHFEIVTENNVGRNERVKGGRGTKRKADSESPATSRKTSKEPKQNKSGEKAKKVKYRDPGDLQALQTLMLTRGKKRTSFSSAEDTLLLICKIASTVISKRLNMKRRGGRLHLAVPSAVMRDVVKANCSEARDKTSFACNRRVRFLTKLQRNKLCHDLSVMDVLDDQSFVRRVFKNYENDQNGDIAELFKNLVAELQERFKNRPGVFTSKIPDTVEELHRRYETRLFGEINRMHRAHLVSDVKTADDIEKCVLENLIYSSLYLDEDQFSAYKAYKVFKTYPENLIKEVWNHVKSSGNICLKITVNTRCQRQLPFSVPAHNLAVTHFRPFQLKFMPRVFAQTIGAVTTFDDSNSLQCDITTTSGSVVLMSTLLLDSRIDVNVEIPESVIASRTVAMRSRSIEGEKLLEEDDDVTNDPKKSSELNDLYDMLNKPLAKDPSSSDARTSGLSKDATILTPCTVTIRKKPRSRSTKPLKKAIDQDSIIGPQLRREVNSCVQALSGDILKTDGLPIAEDRHDQLRQEVDEVTRRQPVYSGLAQELISVVLDGGVVGVTLPVIRHNFCQVKQYGQQQLQQCLELLRQHNIIYFVGMHYRRVVARSNASKWFVKGLVYKGNKSNLAEIISSDNLPDEKSTVAQQPTTSRDMQSSSAAISSEKNKTDGVIVNLPMDLSSVPSTTVACEAPSESDEREPGKSDQLDLSDDPLDLRSPRSVRRTNDEATCSRSDDVETVTTEQNEVGDEHDTAKNKKTMNLDNYEPIIFLCRPWHNVSGEVNYKIAGMVIKGIFNHILWHPGITMKALTDHFIPVMQRVVLLEILEALIASKCITRQVLPRRKSTWRLFEADASDAVTAPSDEDECFTATPSGLLRAAYMNKILDGFRAEQTTPVDHSSATQRHHCLASPKTSS